MNIYQLLDLTVQRNASDLHLAVGVAPLVRINGELRAIPGTPPLSPTDLDALIFPLISPYQKKILEEYWELDFGLEYQNKARFRVNIYKQKGHWAASLRLIPYQIKPLDETGLPPILARVTDMRQGLILVTGPTGHGKSTSLAAFINQINITRSSHIITI